MTKIKPLKFGDRVSVKRLDNYQQHWWEWGTVVDVKTIVRVVFEGSQKTEEINLEDIKRCWKKK